MGHHQSTSTWITQILRSRPLRITFTNSPNTLWTLISPESKGPGASFTQFCGPRHNPIPHQAISLYPLEAPVFLPMTAYRSTPYVVAFSFLTLKPILCYAHRIRKRVLITPNYRPENADQHWTSESTEPLPRGQTCATPFSDA
jgi:hypothetical protein